MFPPHLGILKSIQSQAKAAALQSVPTCICPSTSPESKTSGHSENPGGKEQLWRAPTCSQP
eukprot:12902963-Prorocentrum_lima.AAC.1